MVRKMHSFFFREPQLIAQFFNSQFLFELKHIVRFSKSCMEFPISYSISILLKFIFLFNKMYGLFDF